MAKKRTRSKTSSRASGGASDGRRLSPTITVNRRARYDYDILDSVEAGIALTGTEIKSIRGRRVTLSDSYARPRDGEMWLHNLHIDEYSPAARNNHDPKRPRKLLLHRSQIEDMSRQVEQRGLTLIPLRLYIRNHVAKVELGVARGKKRYDKRRALIEREREKEARAAIGERRW